MAILSVGYPLTIAPGSAWADAHGTAGRRYYARNTESCKVTAVSGGTREVKIAIGAIAGVGIRDYNDAVYNMPSLPSAGVSTYYCIVARRRWNDDAGGNRTEFGYVTAGITRSIPELQRTPGVIDEQPLALVRIDPASTAPGEIVDLRMCGTDSGIFTVFGDLALLDGRLGDVAHDAVSGLTYQYVGVGDGEAWRIQKEPTTGVRPAYFRGRSTEVTNITGERYLGSAEHTSSAGAWGTHFGIEPGSISSGASVPGDRFVFKTAGLYSVQVWAAIDSNPGTGTQELGAELGLEWMNGGVATEWAPKEIGWAKRASDGYGYGFGPHLSDTIYVEAGSRLRFRLYISAARVARLLDWRVRLTKLAD